MSIHSPSHFPLHPTLTLTISPDNEHHAFISHWGNDSCPSSFASISYVNGTTSSQNEAFEEALHISKYFQLPVFGIYHSKTPTPYQESQTLFEFYNHTFSSKPNALIFQVFFGNGGDVVQAAINLLHPSLQQRVIVIGMNPTKLLEHSQSRYFQTYTWPSLHSTKHNITHLHLHPDSNPRHLRSNDPAFSPALQSIALPGANLHYCPQKPQKWTATRIHHATNLALTGLCLSAHASIKIKWLLQSETFRTSTTATTTSPLLPHYFTNLTTLFRTISVNTSKAASTIFHSLPQLLLPGGIFPNGTLPDGSYPHDIFPGRIAPDGKFDLKHIYTRPLVQDFPRYHHWYWQDVNKQHRYPLGEFPNSSFPYLQFFSGVTSDCMIQHGKSRNPSLYTKMGVLPFGIQADGEFLELSYENTRPYGLFHKSGAFILSRACKNTFPYYRFFSGELISERYQEGILPPNDPLYHHLPNGKLPEVYPGYILPNGSFPNPHMEYPFGVFENNSFPYADFFFGNFDYVGRYLEQLNKTNPLLSPFHTNATSNSAIECYSTSSTPFLYNTTITSDSINIDGFSATLAINLLNTPIQEHYEGSQDLLSVAWVIQGSALALLVTTHGSNRITKVRRIALAISSLTTYLAALDLSKQIHSAIYTHEDLFSFSAQGSLIFYNVAYLAQEIINSPWLRNQYERLTTTLMLGKIPNDTLSNGIQLISNIFQHNMAVIRSIPSLIRVYLIAAIGLFFFTSDDAENVSQLCINFCYLGINLILLPYTATLLHMKND